MGIGLPFPAVEAQLKFEFLGFAGAEFVDLPLGWQSTRVAEQVFDTLHMGDARGSEIELGGAVSCREDVGTRLRDAVLVGLGWRVGHVHLVGRAAAGVGNADRALNVRRANRGPLQFFAVDRTALFFDLNEGDMDLVLLSCRAAEVVAHEVAMEIFEPAGVVDRVEVVPPAAVDVAPAKVGEVGEGGFGNFFHPFTSRQ